MTVFVAFGLAATEQAWLDKIAEIQARFPDPT